MHSRTVVVGLIFWALALVGPSAAGAADFCVGSSPFCPVAAYPANQEGISDAITAASNAAGPDRVFLAAGPYPIASAVAPTFSGDIEIIGAGVGQTILTGGSFGGPVISFDFATASSSARDFTVRVSGNAVGTQGINLTKGTLSDFAVEQLGSGSQLFTGVAIGDGALIERGRVSIEAPVETAVSLVSGSATAREISIDGSGLVGGQGFGQYSSTPGTLVIERSRIDDAETGIYQRDHGVILRDSVIDLGSISGAIGIDAFASSIGEQVDIDAARVTIFGASTGTNQRGIRAGASTSSSNFDGGFDDWVAYGASPSFTPIHCHGGDASAHGSTDLRIGNVGFYGSPDVDGSTCSWSFDSTAWIDLLADPPDFRDAATGDFRPLISSPLIDFGSTGGSLAAGAKDLNGNTRLVDGNGDGTAATDLGAIEYQRAGPAIAVRASASSATTGQAIGYAADAVDADGDTFSLSWAFDDGAMATGAAASHAFATPGAHSVTVTGTDEHGFVSRASATVIVVAPPQQEPQPTARLTSKPKKSFKAGKKGFSVAKKRQQPSFTVTFANAARAKLTVQSIGKKKKLKKTKVSSTLSVKDGANKFFFGGGKLKPGKYRVTIAPISPAGVAGKPITVDIKLK